MITAIEPPEKAITKHPPIKKKNILKTLPTGPHNKLFSYYQ